MESQLNDWCQAPDVDVAPGAIDYNHMNQIRFFIFISIALHLALFGMIIWAPSFFHTADLGGGGGEPGTVSVWLAGADGASVGEKKQTPQQGQRARRAEMKADDPALNRQEAISTTTAGTSVALSGSEPGEGVGSGSGSGLGSGSGGDPTLARIWKKINGAKYYPEIARHQGLEGSPRVTFSIRDDGSVGRVELAASCGQAILDEAAKEAVMRAAPLPYYPVPITLAVRYELKR